jgi:hypothetical protein
MHPPFGFALFYLRGIAPKEVKSSDIYWGAVPWVFLQLTLVAIIIFWPGLVTSFVEREQAQPAIEMQVPGNSNANPSAPGAGEPAEQEQSEEEKTAAEIQKALKGR